MKYTSGQMMSWSILLPIKSNTKSVQLNHSGTTYYSTIKVYNNFNYDNALTMLQSMWLS